ncbi:hypothetical protein [Thermomonospora umbrina]|uniref:Uncharacterized protein n=1 Tax=Thermomonospora umbrina TaxID=111806 RepID=A0A3D9T6Q7_9ACTN|nr:hypothetical protein [Thermomonospora umbrina]REE99451.1 hypothetical protein DFJ69_4964 [Thermomonospora umbrina]
MADLLQLVGFVVVFLVVGFVFVTVFIFGGLPIFDAFMRGIGTLILKMLGSSRPASSYTAEEYFGKDRQARKKARKRSSDT